MNTGLTSAGSLAAASLAAALEGRSALVVELAVLCGASALIGFLIARAMYRSRLAARDAKLSAVSGQWRRRLAAERDTARRAAADRSRRAPRRKSE